jgi:hypothetical protein
MILQAGERTIASEPVESLVGPALQNGYLYLTNVRLVFEGLFWEGQIGWIPRTLLELYVHQISNAIAAPGKGTRQTLRIEAGRGYVYTFTSLNAAYWVNSIVKAKAAAPAAPAAAATGGQVPVIVNVQQPPSQPTVFLHCKHCGSLSAAGSMHCTSCGATL